MDLLAKDGKTFDNSQPAVIGFDDANYEYATRDAASDLAVAGGHFDTSGTRILEPDEIEVDGVSIFDWNEAGEFVRNESPRTFDVPAWITGYHQCATLDQPSPFYWRDRFGNYHCPWCVPCPSLGMFGRFVKIRQFSDGGGFFVELRMPPTMQWPDLKPKEVVPGSGAESDPNFNPQTMGEY